MNVTCPSCDTVYRVDPAKVPDGGVDARCAECSDVFRVEAPGTGPPPTSDEDAVVAPAPDEEARQEEAPEPTPSLEAEPEEDDEEGAGAYGAGPTFGMEPTEAEGVEASEADPTFGTEPEEDEELHAPDTGRAFETPGAAPEEPEPGPEEPEPGPAGVSDEASFAGLTPSADEDEEPGVADSFEQEVTPEAAPGPEVAPDPDGIAGPDYDEATTPAEEAERGGEAGAPAFGQQTPDDRARRLARALVSDMVVYNPERREESLADGTLRQEFRDEIRKSWEEYVEQVGEERAKNTPYFRQALNEILAGGEEIF